MMRHDGAELVDGAARQGMSGLAPGVGPDQGRVGVRGAAVCERGAGTAPPPEALRRPEQGGDKAFVAFDGVSKTYDGDTLAVANLDLGIRKGEFVTLLGPSG